MAGWVGQPPEGAGVLLIYTYLWLHHHFPTSKLAKWQNGKVANWQSGKMVKWQNGKMAKWQIGKAAKWLTGSGILT